MCTMVLVAEHEHSHERSSSSKGARCQTCRVKTHADGFYPCSTHDLPHGWRGLFLVAKARHASGWSLPELIALMEQFALIDALCDGCAFGFVSNDNLPLLKPWRIVTSNKRLATNLSAYRCRHSHGYRHAPVEGSSLGDPPFIQSQWLG